MLNMAGIISYPEECSHGGQWYSLGPPLETPGVYLVASAVGLAVIRGITDDLHRMSPSLLMLHDSKVVITAKHRQLAKRVLENLRWPVLHGVPSIANPVRDAIDPFKLYVDKFELYADEDADVDAVLYLQQDIDALINSAVASTIMPGSGRLIEIDCYGAVSIDRYSVKAVLAELRR